MPDVEAIVKTFISESLLQGSEPAELSSDTLLLSSGILDSIATLRLVMFLEERFGIEVAPSDLTPDNLGSLERIAKLVNANVGPT